MPIGGKDGLHQQFKGIFPYYRYIEKRQTSQQLRLRVVIVRKPRSNQHYTVHIIWFQCIRHKTAVDQQPVYTRLAHYLRKPPERFHLHSSNLRLAAEPIGNLVEGGAVNAFGQVAVFVEIGDHFRRSSLS